MTNSHSFLIINPGSTSTKLALVRNHLTIASETIQHTVEDLQPFPHVSDQSAYRKKFIAAFLTEYTARDPSVELGLSAVVGRGGLLHPLQSGVYAVNDLMIGDLIAERYGEHASNLGGILAHAFASDYGCPAYIVDPVVVDEMVEAARYSGIPHIRRKSIFHALNQKATARRAAAVMGKRYEDCRFIVAHLGGGISVGAHINGKVVDVNNALDGDGPFSAERSGGLPAGQLTNLIMKQGAEETRRLITGGGGLIAYCGTNSIPGVLRRIDEGDPEAALVFEAMIHQVSKEIAMHGATLRGTVDRIILTGGMAESKRVTGAIVERVGYLAPVIVYPGEGEMEALADGALRVLDEGEAAMEYVSEN